MSELQSWCSNASQDRRSINARSKNTCGISRSAHSATRAERSGLPLDEVSAAPKIQTVAAWHTADTRDVGKIKKALQYNVERQNEKVVIGPTRSGISTIGSTHEHGKSRKIPNPRRRRIRKIGDGGEIAIGRPSGKTVNRTRLGNVSVTFIKLRTPGQVARSNRLNRMLYGPDEIIVGRYPKRPLMGPALEKVKDRLPKLWGTSIQQ